MSIMQLVVDNYFNEGNCISENENKNKYVNDFEKLKTKEYIKADEEYHDFLKSIHNRINDTHNEIDTELLDFHETTVNSYISECERINFILGFQYASKVFKELYLMGGVDGE